jgi:hypothetical protein
LVVANWPPFGFTQVQTFGGVYSDELLIDAAPVFRALRRPALARQPRRGIDNHLGFDLTAA